MCKPDYRTATIVTPLDESKLETEGLATEFMDEVSEHEHKDQDSWQLLDEEVTVSQRSRG